LAKKSANDVGLCYNESVTKSKDLEPLLHAVGRAANNDREDYHYEIYDLWQKHACIGRLERHPEEKISKV
jgi:hypothetical protein